jgi:hypothetical protein
MGIGAVFIAGALNDIVFLGAFIARLAFLLACFILVISFYLKKFSEKGLCRKKKLITSYFQFFAIKYN